MAKQDHNQILIKSQFLHLVELENGNFICHQINKPEPLVLSPAIIEILHAFSFPTPVSKVISAFAKDESETAERCISFLLKTQLLYAGTHEQELTFYKQHFSKTLGRDYSKIEPGALRDTPRYPSDVWVVQKAIDGERLKELPHRAEVISIGYCYLEFGMDIFRELARNYQLDLSTFATYPSDLALLTERSPNIVILGMFYSHFRRVLLANDYDKTAHDAYIQLIADHIDAIRAHTDAPLLIDGIPGPQVTPLGIAETVESSHHHRTYCLNRDLQTLCKRKSNTFFVDLDKSFCSYGKLGVLDDTTFTFGHLGSLWWIYNYPDSQRPEVQQFFPFLEEAYGHRGKYLFERVMAETHLQHVIPLLGIEKIKLIVVDLDNTLWPGVLADYQAPLFWWNDRVAVPDLFAGIHEALLAMKKRGILLACVSKNDENVIKKLWIYDHLPTQVHPMIGNPTPDELVQLKDLVTYRINWKEKVENIQSIVQELNIGLDSVAFIDDNPIEREKVKQYLPEIFVLGDNPFEIRWTLLQHPSFQTPYITQESLRRTDMVKQQLLREKQRATYVDNKEFIKSIRPECIIKRLNNHEYLDRLHELVTRTNQFNITTKRYSKSDLIDFIARPEAAIFSLQAKDCFTDYGLVGVAITTGNIIDSFILSCRVIGLEMENVFIRTICKQLSKKHQTIEGQYIATDRNQPARHLFKNNGFQAVNDTLWRLNLGQIPHTTLAVPEYFTVITA